MGNTWIRLHERRAVKLQRCKPTKKLTKELRRLAGDVARVYVKVDEGGIPLSFQLYQERRSRA